jgi:hypothetical protein
MPEETKQPLKGWDAAYTGKVPIRGTFAYAKYLSDKKDKEKESSLTVVVDNSLLVSEEAPSKNESPSVSEAPSKNESPSVSEAPSKNESCSSPNNTQEPTQYTTSKNESPSVSEAPSKNESPSKIEAGGVRITRNYMFFDVDIFRAIKDMTGNEIRIYLDLILKTYGQIRPKNICSITNPEIASRTGINSSASFANAFRSLEQKGYIQRIFAAHQKKQKSIYRVFLPCEVRGNHGSRTLIESTET